MLLVTAFLLVLGLLGFERLATCVPFAIVEEKPSTATSTRQRLWACLSLQVSDGCILILAGDF